MNMSPLKRNDSSKIKQIDLFNDNYGVNYGEDQENSIAQLDTKKGRNQKTRVEKVRINEKNIGDKEIIIKIKSKNN